MRTVSDALAAAGLTTFLQVNGVSVAGAALPLFRRGTTGELEQVVRLVFTPPAADVRRVELVRPDGGIAVSWTGSLFGDGVLDLLVSEIRSAATWTVALTLADVEYRGLLPVAPGRKLVVHLVHHSHLDIGSTDTQGVVLRHQVDYLDTALALARQSEDTDPATRFRWTVESNLPFRTWLRHRPRATVEEFCRLARMDILEVTAMPFNLHTEMASQEELASLLRTAVELREVYNIPIRSAMHTDVPGATTGWVDALAEAGVRYLSAAHNWAGRSVPYLLDGQDLTRPFWWCTPGGARLLTWFTDSAHGAAYFEGNLVGLSTSYTDTLALLPLYLHALVTRPFPFSDGVDGLSGIPEDAERTRRPYAFDLLQLRVQGGPSDNAGPSRTPVEIARRWNAEWTYPRLVTATNASFLAAAETAIGDEIAEHCGDWGDWRVDGMGAGARPLGYNRRTQGILRTAETVHALADLQAGARHPVRETVDSIYDKVGLFDEHTWSAANPWHDSETGLGSGGLQWMRKQDYAHQAYDEALDLLQGGIHRLGAGVGTASFTDALGSLAVYNTTGRPRTDVVRAFVPEDQLNGTLAEEGLLAIVDTRKDERVPARVAAVDRPAAPRGWELEFVAREVPSLGWVRFDLVATGERPVEDAFTETVGSVADTGTDLGEATAPAPKSAYRLANDYYELTYDPIQAMVTSIVDRRTGRELVNPHALTGVNEYIVDRYGSAPHVPHLSGRVRASDLTLLTARHVGRHAVVHSLRHSALGDELEVELKAPGVDWIRTTISLHAGVPRVDITNRIHKSAGSAASAKESMYFAFPLAGTNEPLYELTGSIAGADIPHVPGGPAHVHGIRHWVGIRDDDYAIVWATLESPLVQFGTIALPYPPFPSTIDAETSEPATIYSCVLNNLWDTNFPSEQRGEMTFRYAIAGSATESVQALGASTAAGLTDPLVPVLAAGEGVAPIVSSGSLLAVNTPEVVVSSVGRPRDGSDGIAVRLRSLALRTVDVELTLEGFDASSAALSTLLEQPPPGVPVDEVPIRDGRVTVRLPAGTTRTLLLRP